MVYRIYVEKKQGLQTEADGLRNDLVQLLGIRALTGLRLLNRYDFQNHNWIICWKIFHKMAQKYLQ